MTKELSDDKAIEISNQIGKIFISNDTNLFDCRHILAALIMGIIRQMTSNKLDDNLKEAKHIYEAMISAFEETK